MSRKTSFTVKNLRGKEIDITMNLAVREGWNVGIHDADGFYAADHDGFFAGMLGDKIVASMFGINYGNDFGYLGRYIVEPEYRGNGYGIKIWETALEHVGNRPLGLNAAKVMEEKYTRYGFKTAYTGARYTTLSHKRNGQPEGLVTLNELPFADLLDFDRKFFPAYRANFLKSWIVMPESRSYAVVDSRREIHACGLIRRFMTGWKIGPLFATNSEAADLCYNAMQNAVPENEPVCIDIAMNNPNALALATRYGMEKVFENVRMYKGKIPDFDASGIYSSTSQELG